MFVDLGTFINEKEVYNKKVEELNNTITDENELNKALIDAKAKFKSNMRKYLPTAISVIKNTFRCDYSLYKVGRDVDANFHTIETNVNKTQIEIAEEMNQFVQQANGMGLSADAVNKLNLAIDIIMNYVDDNVVVEDESKTNYLKHSKVVASSLDLPVTQKMDSAVSEPAIQHNPYANQPLNFNSEVSTSTNNASKSLLTDPFASVYASDNNSTLEQKQVSMPTQVVAAPVIPQAEVPATKYVAPTQKMVIPNREISVPNRSVFSNDVEVVKEYNIVIPQIICAILIPIMVLLSGAVYYYIGTTDFIVEFLSKMPDMLRSISSGLILATICLILSGPIISFAKSRTRYLERFMIPPMLLSMPLGLLLVNLLLGYKPSSLDDLITNALIKFISMNGDAVLELIVIIGLVLYFPFCIVLFFRAFANGNNNISIKSPSWNIFDIIGLILLTYTTLIPGICFISVMFEVTDFIEFVEPLYTKFASYSKFIFFILPVIVSALIMGYRSIIQKRVGRKS